MTVGVIEPGSNYRDARDHAACAWIRAHPQVNATQLMFLRALRQAVLSRTRIESRGKFHQPPFSRIGGAESERQRRSIHQPRVARNELPWDRIHQRPSTLKGLHRPCAAADATPLGLW